MESTVFKQSTQKPLQSWALQGHQLRTSLFSSPCTPEGISCKLQFPIWEASEQKTEFNSWWPSGSRNSQLVTLLRGCFILVEGAVCREDNEHGRGLWSSACECISGCGWVVCIWAVEGLKGMCWMRTHGHAQWWILWKTMLFLINFWTFIFAGIRRRERHLCYAAHLGQWTTCRS